MESVFLLWWTVYGITVDLYALSNHRLYGSYPWNSLFYVSKATKKTRNNYFDSENKFEIAILTVNDFFSFVCTNTFLAIQTKNIYIYLLSYL